MRNYRERPAILCTRLRKLSLSELVAATATVIILSGLLVPKIVGGPDEARRVLARREIGLIVQALTVYRSEHGHYPTQEPGLRALIKNVDVSSAADKRKDNGYFERLPIDPWGHAYQYRNPGVHGDVDVFSYGADGKQGGEGDDADIGSWN